MPMEQCRNASMLQNCDGLASLLSFPGVADRIGSLAPTNDVSTCLRLVNKETAAYFSSPEHKIVHLSKPVQPAIFRRHFSTAANALSPGKRRYLIELTVTSGCLANVETAVELTGTEIPNYAWCFAARKGHIHMCEYLLDNNVKFDKECEALIVAAMFDRKDVCVWLLSHGYVWSAHAVCTAVKGANFELAEWLLQQRPSDRLRRLDLWRKTLACGIVEAAAEGCDLPTFQRVFSAFYEEPSYAQQPQDQQHAQVYKLRALVYSQRAQYDDLADDDSNIGLQHEQFSIMAWAAASTTPDWRQKIEWLESKGLRGDGQACLYAGCLPDAMERFAWMRQRGYPISCGAIENAVMNHGGAAAAQMLAEYERREEEEARPFTAAAAGDLEVLMELHAAGCPALRTPDIVYIAAARGHLRVVAWLMEGAGLGLQLTVEIFSSAARSGSVELIAWLRERGCPWGVNVFKMALLARSVEAVEWLASHGCPMPGGFEPLRVAAGYDDREMVRCLRQLGCPWGGPGELFSACLEAGHYLSTLRWLVEEGCPVDLQASVEAARQLGRDEVVEWLLQVQGQGQAGAAAPPPAGAQAAGAVVAAAARRSMRWWDEHKWDVFVLAAAAAALCAVAVAVQRSAAGRA